MTVFYHGSPEPELRVDHRMLFVTPDRAVAESYARGQTYTQSIRTANRVPTVFTVRLRNLRTLDLRIPEHRLQFEVLRQAFNATADPDERIPRLGSPGFIQRSGLPGYGHVRSIALACPKYNSLWVDEGSQGLSLALFDPRTTCQVVKQESVLARIVTAALQRWRSRS